MRTTVVLDDELVTTASELTGIGERTGLLREALRALIAREAAKRLAALTGLAPDAALAPRRQFAEVGTPFVHDTGADQE